MDALVHQTNSINFTKANKKLSFSLHYNADNCYLLVHGKKSLSLTCIVRLTLIYLNTVELKYYPFMISLDKCSGNCNILSLKISVPKESEDETVKAFNMLANKNEAKTMTNYISCGCKCKLNSAPCNSDQKWNIKTCQCE